MRQMKLLLEGKGVTLNGEVSPRQVRRARDWFTHARFLAENFTEFDFLRRGLMHQAHAPAARCKRVCDYLEEAGLLLQQRGGLRPASHDADAFLRGQWLEEYVYMAFHYAGADAATFHQAIHWRIDEFEGDNEIDVIARVGDRLAFASCKAMKPYPNTSGSQNYRGALINFLNEIDNVQGQYGYPWATAFLFTTTDFTENGGAGQSRYGSIRCMAPLSRSPDIT